MKIAAACAVYSCTQYDGKRRYTLRFKSIYFFEIGLSPSGLTLSQNKIYTKPFGLSLISKQNIYFTNLGIYFNLPNGIAHTHSDLMA